MLALGCALSVASAAAGAVSQGDLQATTQALGFLDALNNRPVVAIAVVAASNDADKRQEAQAVAGLLGAMRIGKGAAIHTGVMTPDELAQGAQRPDALYLMPGASASPRIVDFVKRRRVVSLSNDPTCLSSDACVLMVRGGEGVDIVFDTALADAAGARFASVFTMMVKRK